VLRYYRHPLGAADRQALASELSFLTQRRERFRRFALIASVLVLLVGLPLAVMQGRDDANLLYLALFVVAVYLGIVVWAYRENLGDDRRRETSLRGALEMNVARVLHCRPSACLAVPEIEDEGPGYFLQVDNDTVLYLAGQLYYATTSFPSTDFELIEVLDAAGLPSAFRIDCHGERLLPLRTLTAETKVLLMDKDALPEDLILIDGTIEGLEDRLLNGSARFSPLQEET
jgi:hypothetical protein